MSLTDQEIEQGISHLSHQFMQPQVWRERISIVADDMQEMELPEDEADARRDGFTMVKPTKRSAWWAQLSAPGYMDRTDTAGPFDTEREAAEYLCETYADDIDDCDECAEDEEQEQAS